MPPARTSTPPPLEVLESYEKVFLAIRQAVTASRGPFLSRLVWYVAIAGYAILNAPTLWATLAGHELKPASLVLLSLPWVLSTLASVVAHWFAGEIALKDDLFFITKLAMIDLHKLDLRAGKVDPKLVAGIIDDTHADLVAPAKEINRLRRISDLSERIGFAFLIAGFAWTFLGPFLLC